MKLPLIGSFILGFIICVVIFVVSTILIIRNTPIFIHPELTTIYLKEADEIINRFDLVNKFTFSPSNPKRNKLAQALGIKEQLQDDEFLCCAVNSVIVEAYYKWPPIGGATGIHGQAIIRKVENCDDILHVVKLRWPKNSFIVPMPVTISESRIKNYLNVQEYNYK